MRINRNDNDDSKYYFITVHANKGVDEDIVAVADAFVKSYEMKVNKNWKYKTKIIVDKLESIDLTYGSNLRNTIDNFIKITNSLPSLKNSSFKGC